MEKIKISNHQLFALTANYTCGAAIIVISGGVTSIVKQDAWITIFPTLLLGMLIVWLIYFLGRQYPDMTFVEMIVQILGKWLGWVIAWSFILLCLEQGFQILWYIGDFVTLQAMPETPPVVINLIFIIVIVIAVSYGIETIARASEVFLYAISAFFILTMLLVLPNAKIENLLPIFEKGIAPTLKGALLLSSSMTFPIIVIMMVYPSNISSTLSETPRALFF